jgi:EpsI family protein
MLAKNILISIGLLLVALLAVFGISQRGTPQVVATNLEKIPMQIDGYDGTEDRFPQSVYDALGADLHLYRHYQNTHGDQVDLYIGYYGTAKGGRTGHNPYACFPSAGWGIIENDTLRLAARSYQEKVDVNYMLIKKDDVHLIVLHWYQSEGVKVLDTGLKQNIQRLIGKILRNKNDGAFVRLSTEAREAEVPAAKASLIAFSQKVLEQLPNHWPVEK